MTILFFCDGYEYNNPYFAIDKEKSINKKEKNKIC